MGAGAGSRRWTRLASVGPFRLPTRVRPRAGAGGDAAPTLRPPPRRADPPVRPSQPAHAADRGRVPLLDEPRLPLLGVHLYRRRRRAHHRRLAPAQAERPRRRLDCGPRASAASHGVLDRRSQLASFGPATSSPPPGMRRRSSAVRGGTASRTRSSSTCATRTATASSCTRATTTPAIPTSSHCAGPSTTHAAAPSGARGRPTAGMTSRRASSGLTARSWRPRTQRSTSAISTPR